MDKQELLQYGRVLNTSYGISNVFEWKTIEYKGKRYLVSMFDDTVELISKTYCNICGKAGYKYKCCGQYKG